MPHKFNHSMKVTVMQRRNYDVAITYADKEKGTTTINLEELHSGQGRFWYLFMCCEKIG